jgi:molybdate transport system ATP-binding protein
MDTLHIDLDHPLRSFRLELTLDVAVGTLALAGPSGAGKTTVLRAVAGLLRAQRARIELGDEVWADSAQRLHVPPERRSVGLVFQEYALFPHLSAERNVAFGARGRVDSLLAAFGIAHLAHARPGELSGGERQRVALARALAREPRVLLLDEPLGALDTHTRATVRGDLRDRLRKAGLPTLLVTHDFADAAALADRVAVLDGGRVVQIGTPAELVAAPRSPFVASFAGGNVLRGRASAGAAGLTSVVLEDGSSIVSTDVAEGDVAVVIYPWDVALARGASGDSMLNHVFGPVASVAPVGNRLRVRVGPLTAEITTASAERLRVREGEYLRASFKATGTRLLPLGRR